MRTPAAERGPRIPEALVARHIVPALLAELAREPGAERTGAALNALARLGPRSFEGARWNTTIEVLLAHLAHRDRAVKASACLALGLLGDTAAVPVLVELVRAGERAEEHLGRARVPESLRTLAAYALGAAVDTLARADVARFAALELLGVLASDEAALDLRVAAAVALGECGRADAGAPDQGVLDALLARVQARDEHEYVRAQAATSVARVLQEAQSELRHEALALLLEVLAQERTTPPALRQGLALALGRLAEDGPQRLDVAARSALRALAEEGDRAARGFALVALAEIGSRGATSREEESFHAVPAPRTTEIEEFLRAALLTSKDLQRPWAALALGLHGHGLARRGLALEPASRVALARLAGRERSAETAGALALAAGLAGAADATEMLVERRRAERDPGYSSLALGFLRHGAALDELRAETGRADHDFARLARVATARALCGDGELVPELVTRLGAAECDRARIALAHVLGTLGDARAVEPLVAHLGDEFASDRRRAWAAFALGRLAEERELPWITLYATRVNYLAAPPSLSSPHGGGLLELR